MNEIKKEPRGAEALDDEKSRIVYGLQCNINGEIYFVIDLNGSLSRNVMDSMLFWDELSATSFAGPIEHLIEGKVDAPSTIRVVELPLSGVIPKTPLECIPSP